ncbi:hypothetical protein AB0K52_00140 [Glycomyces sp. NPDC049804]|uniref:hypothetical protein n=1 Tax=Glycomyces sp. NPDC049804 TaxID=3154363 RepID=UPI00344ABEF9
MPRLVNVPTGATQHLIRQAYEAGGKYQWAREAWKNSQESGATRIEFGIETQALQNLGVYRRVILDNGMGMSPEEMPDFLTTFGGGGKPISLDENFGQGFKSSVLPWNPHGVVVISYTRDNPDGSMLWIEQVRSGDYALRSYPILDEDYDEYMKDVVVPHDDPEAGCDWSKLRPDWMTTGTIMVLMGSDRTSDTMNGDPEKGETGRGIVKYLNERLLNVPKTEAGPIETRVYDLEIRKSKGARRETQDVTYDLPNGTTVALHQRMVRGLSHYIPESAIKGTVVVDAHGTVVEWYHVPEEHRAVNGSDDYISQKPVVTVEYHDEAFHSSGAKSRYRQFGITDELMQRTWLIVRPPAYSEKRPTAWGVLSQASRNMLIPKGGRDLPWDEWGDAFYAQFPEELAEIRDRLREQDSTHSSPDSAKNLERILDALNPRFKAARVLSNSMGSVKGYPSDRIKVRPAASRLPRPASGGSGTPPRPGTRPEAEGPRTPIIPAATGLAVGVSTNVRGGYPGFDWGKFDPDEAKHLARFDAKDTVSLGDGTVLQGVVYLNRSHPVFVQETTYWQNAVWPKADPERVRQLVEEVYGEEAVAHVVHAQRLNGVYVGDDEDGKPVRIDNGDVESLLSPEALSGSLLGLVNVQQRIITRGGGTFGKRAQA